MWRVSLEKGGVSSTMPRSISRRAALGALGSAALLSAAGFSKVFFGNHGAMSPLEERLFPLYAEVDQRFDLDDELVLLVDGGSQKMYVVSEDENSVSVERAYDISTARNGFGNGQASYRTPLGIHQISEKIGDGAPLGTIFRGRENTGRRVTIYTDDYNTPQDAVTTRILWLDGVQPENRNSHSRYIYIHGTPEEGLIGTPQSHGCIRMRNNDVIELYGHVPVGTYVNIADRVN